MRPAIVVALLVVCMPLSVLAPVATALDWCVALGFAQGHRCERHVACLHRLETGPEESCLYGLERVLP